jgi:hypothetical protein
MKATKARSLRDFICSGPLVKDSRKTGLVNDVSHIYKLIALNSLYEIDKLLFKMHGKLRNLHIAIAPGFFSWRPAKNM